MGTPAPELMLSIMIGRDRQLCTLQIGLTVRRLAGILTVLPGNVLDRADPRHCILREPGVRHHSRVVADLFVDDLHARGIRDVVQLCEVFIGMGGEHRHCIFTPSGARAFLNHTYYTGVVLNELPHLVEDSSVGVRMSEGVPRNYRAQTSTISSLSVNGVGL